MSFPQPMSFGGMNYHAGMNYYPPNMLYPQAPVNDSTIPQRKVECFCIFTKNDESAKQKKIPISNFPCTISGYVTRSTSQAFSNNYFRMSIPTVNIKLPKSFDATFQIVNVDQKLFLWTHESTQITVNEKNFVGPNDYLQLRTGDYIRLAHWICEFEFKTVLSVPTFIDQLMEDNSTVTVQPQGREPVIPEKPLQRVSSMPPSLKEISPAKIPPRLKPSSGSASFIPSASGLPGAQKTISKTKQKTKSDDLETSTVENENENTCEQTASLQNISVDDFLALSSATASPSQSTSDEILCTLSDSSEEILAVLSDSDDE